PVLGMSAAMGQRLGEFGTGAETVNGSGGGWRSGSVMARSTPGIHQLPIAVCQRFFRSPQNFKDLQGSQQRRFRRS
ncbi:MAG: hypothetical protein ACO4AJ_07260, partial [Prochlorothrix sp.]